MPVVSSGGLRRAPSQHDGDAQKMQASTTRRLVIAAAALGLPSLPADKLIVSASAELRAALDDGLSPTHPRCEALLLLIDSARIHLTARNRRSAPRADGLSRTSDETANDIDMSAAATANAIGLRDAARLRGCASAVLKGTASRSGANSAPDHDKRETRSGGGLGSTAVIGKRAGPMKLRLQPRPALSSVQALFALAQTDSALGRSAILYRKAKEKPPVERKRRSEPRKKRRSALRKPSIGSPSDVAPLPTYRASHQMVPQAMSLYQNNTQYYPQQLSLSGHPYVPPALQPSHMHYPMSHPVHSNAPVMQQQTAQQTQNLLGQNPQGAIASNVVGPHPVSSPIIQQFMNPTQAQPAHQAQPLDPETSRAVSIRAVLAERERDIIRRLSDRHAELLSLPLGVSEDTRRKAIIESKQLKLLELQRVVRSRLCVEMKKSWSPSYQEFGVVPSDNLSRLFRRRNPPIYSYTDGYQRIGPFDGLPQLPQRSAQTIALDSRKMAHFDYRRMQSQKVRGKHIFASKLVAHVQNFENHFAYAISARNRICKGIQRYFLEKARAEEKRKKQEQYERLRLLRSNDEQAYLNLLKTTKNERLLQLVRQTDNYLMQIGAQVEKVRDKKDPGMSVGRNMFVEELEDSAGSSVPIESMRRRRDMYYTVTHSVNEEVGQPSIMVHGKLKPYQVEGLKWMVSLYNNSLNGILADEMGLGKTIQTIALLTYLIEKKQNPGPYIIIVPLSTVGNWVRELDLWAPSVSKVVYRGNRDARREAHYRMQTGGFHVLITTYEFVVRDQNVLSRYNWKYIIIDEGHRMKNANSKLATTLGSKYKSKNRLLLTGTPLQNNLTELWALLNFILPSIFSSSETFEQWFKKPFETTTLGDSAELEEEETLLVINRLHQVLRPFLLRRLKTDVEAQLPEKLETVIRCDMSMWQRVLYRQVKAKVGLATGTGGSVRSYNNLLMQCKKICNHPYLFYDGEAIDNLPGNMMIRSSGKFHLLHNMIPKLKETGHRTLIFSQMTHALDYLEDFLSEIGIQYMRLDGATKSDDRQTMLNEFNAPDSPYFCFLLSTRAGGLGLNLQTADTVIIFDSDWNPQMDLQAQDRAHRIGQKSAVRVFRLISSGTVEVKILEQANKKLQIDAQVIQAGQFNNKSTESDQHQMLKGLLNKKNDDGDELGDVPSLEELNQIIARDEDEFEKFTAMDAKREEQHPYDALLTAESELPAWVLEPDVQAKTAEEREKEILESHGRGRRKRGEIRDITQLTEKEWMDVMEGTVTADEVFEKRRLRRATVRKNLVFDDSSSNEDESKTDEEHQPSSGRKRKKPSSTPKRKRRRAGDSSQSRTASKPGSNSRDVSDTESVEQLSSDDEAVSGSTDPQPRRSSARSKRLSARNGKSGSSGLPNVSVPLRLILRPGVRLPPPSTGNPVSLPEVEKGAHSPEPSPDGDTHMTSESDTLPNGLLKGHSANSYSVHRDPNVNNVEPPSSGHTSNGNGHAPYAGDHDLSLGDGVMAERNHMLTNSKGFSSSDSGSGSGSDEAVVNGIQSNASEVASTHVISPSKRSPRIRTPKLNSIISDEDSTAEGNAEEEPVVQMGNGKRKRKSVAFADEVSDGNGLYGESESNKFKKSSLLDAREVHSSLPTKHVAEESSIRDSIDITYAGNRSSSSIKLRLPLAPPGE